MFVWILNKYRLSLQMLGGETISVCLLNACDAYILALT